MTLQRSAGNARLPSLLWLMLASALPLPVHSTDDVQTDIETTSPAPLLAVELLQRSAAHVPQILAAGADRRARAGAIQEAQGAFDTTISADSYSRVSGFYDGQLATTKISQPLEDYSAEVYGSYRLSRGSFPVYEDINFTNLGGELKLGVALSLLRDRDIDQRRFQRNDARLALDVADYELQAVFLDVQRSACRPTINGRRWVCAGRCLLISCSLLLNVSRGCASESMRVMQQRYY